jgi:ribonuclease PH
MAPKWLQGTGNGWVTAEYGMLPRSTHTRIRRDKAMNSGRTQEISRLIGRSLRAAVDLRALGEKQIIVDCDVIHADGGTRTAAVSGGFVALALALKKLHDVAETRTLALQHYVSAVSVGLSREKQILLDLNYDEDSTTGSDVNFVVTDSQHLIEVQGTAEALPFTRDQLIAMTDMAYAGCAEIFRKQAEIVAPFFALKVRN